MTAAGRGWPGWRWSCGTPSSGTLTTNHENTMQTENDTPKPKDSPQQESGEGCPEATCSAGLLFDDGTIMRVVKSGKRAEAWICEAAENPREMYEYSTNFILRHEIGFANVSCSQCGRDFGRGGTRIFSLLRSLAKRSVRRLQIRNGARPI